MHRPLPPDGICDKKNMKKNEKKCEEDKKVDKRQILLRKVRCSCKKCKNKAEKVFEE
jgi:hypothetical protein